MTEKPKENKNENSTAPASLVGRLVMCANMRNIDKLDNSWRLIGVACEGNKEFEEALTNVRGDVGEKNYYLSKKQLWMDKIKALGEYLHCSSPREAHRKEALQIYYDLFDLISR